MWVFGSMVLFTIKYIDLFERMTETWLNSPPCVSDWSLCSPGGGGSGAFPYNGSLPLASHHHHGYKHHGSYPGRHTPYPTTYLPHLPHSSGKTGPNKPGQMNKHEEIHGTYCGFLSLCAGPVCLSDSVQALSDGWSVSSPRPASSSSSLSSPASLPMTTAAPSSPPPHPHGSRWEASECKRSTM